MRRVQGAAGEKLTTHADFAEPDVCSRALQKIALPVEDGVAAFCGG